MATNIIDAFVVTFGIKDTGYQAATRDIEQRNRRLRDDSKKTFDEMENRGKNLGQTFCSMRNELVGLVLAFAGGSSLMGFAQSLIRNEASASRMSDTLGVATNRVLAWRAAVKQMGGAAGDADAALQSINQMIWNAKLTGTTGHDAELARLGIGRNILNMNADQVLMRLSQARSRMTAQEFGQYLQRIGLPQSVIYLLEQGTDKLQAQMKAAEQLAAVTKRDEEAAKRLESALAKLQTTIQGRITPALTPLIEQFIEFIEKNDVLRIVIPVITGLLGAMAIAAMATYWPFFALAGVIALVAANMDGLRKKYQELKDAWKGAGESSDWLFDPFRKMFGGLTGKEARENDTDIWGNPNSATLAIVRDRITKKLTDSGVEPETARGIVAGLWAESKLNAQAKNPKSGAYGIAQWLGGRQKELFRRYGNAPSLDQQVEFLLWELRGGDAGMARALRMSQGKTAEESLQNFITHGERPQGNNWERMDDWRADIRRGMQFLGKSQATNGNATQGINIQNVTVNTQATDANGIARDFGRALKQRALVAQADRGVAA